MKKPTLTKTVFLSAALHLSVMVMAILVQSQYDRIEIPSPYVVSLVGPQTPFPARGGGEVREPVRPEKAPAEAPQPSLEKETKRKPTKDSRADEGLINKRIAEIAAKEKIRRLADVKSQMKKIASVRSGPLVPGRPLNSGGSSSGGGREATYIDTITREIHDYWDWYDPDTGRKSLMTIVAITILKDGTIFEPRIEKSSGNKRFDNSALRAVLKASPVTPPPGGEMEIGIRFYL